MHDENLYQRAENDRERKPADMNKHRRTVRRDRIGDEREHAERRRLHHQRDDPEEHRRGRLKQRRERLAALPRQHRADAEQDRDEDQREHIALRQRLDDVGGDDPHQLVVGADRRAERVRRSRAERRTFAGA